jgi:formylmethanofuran dehydrogenase subunit D
MPNQFKTIRQGKVIKINTSLMLCLSDEFKKMGLKQGDSVNVSANKSEIIITRSSE